MELKPVESTNIESVGYDGPTRTLAIKFRGGSLYHYHGVTAATHAGLIGAESIGKFFRAHINGKFTYTKRKENGNG